MTAATRPLRAAGDAVDSALLRAAADGDEAAFARLHARHVAACARRAGFVLAAPDLVDDVVQAVFLDVWMHARRYDQERGSVRGWLLRLTHHKAVDVVRAQERHRAKHVREQLLLPEAEPARPDDVVVDQLERDRLSRAVDQLPAAQRDVLVLCFLDQLSQREAAAVLGVPVGTVKSRTHTAVLRLRLLLGAREPQPAAQVAAVEALA